MDHQAFLSDYSQLMYPPTVAPEVTAALKDLTESELDLQKALGDETMLAMWTDPYFPPLLKQTTEHLADLRNTRLKAEDAEEHLDEAFSRGGDPVTLESLWFGSKLLDYAGQKFQTAPELEAMWQRLDPIAQ